MRLLALTRSATVVTALVVLMAPAGHAAPEEAGASALRYWTEERMAAAVPGDPPGSSLETITDHPVSATVEPVAAQQPMAELTAASRPYTDPGERVHGKVFWTRGSTNSWCSASTVTAPNKSLVWSAAHCLSGTTNVMFVPAYNSGGSGDAPYGRWPAKRVATSGNDHAAVVVQQLGGKYLQDVVGANGVRFNGPVGGRTTIWGYPAARIWSGRDLTHCNQATRWGGGSSTTTPCDTEGGSSGGGYITGAPTPTGLGYLWANHTAGSGASAIGSVFGATAKRLYDSTAS